MITILFQNWSPSLCYAESNDLYEYMIILQLASKTHNTNNKFIGYFDDACKTLNQRI